MHEVEDRFVSKRRDLLDDPLQRGPILVEPMVNEIASELEGRGALDMQRLAMLEAAARELLDSNIAMHSLQVGEAAPDFELPDGAGRLVRLSELLRAGPTVLTFYRGQWCRWCRGLLAALEGATTEIHALGAQLVALSPQTPSWSRATAETCSLSYPVLSDVENRVARRFGLAYTLPAAFQWAYARLGIDVPVHNDSQSFELPVPATYVIARDHTIAYAFVSPDYTRRPNPSEILAALRRMPLTRRASDVRGGKRDRSEERNAGPFRSPASRAQDGP